MEEDVPVSVMLENGWTEQTETLNALKAAGLDETTLFKSVNIITGVVPPSMVESLKQVKGVDRIVKTDETKCCGGSCGCSSS